MVSKDCPLARTGSVSGCRAPGVGVDCPIGDGIVGGRQVGARPGFRPRLLRLLERSDLLFHHLRVHRDGDRSPAQPRPHLNYDADGAGVNRPLADLLAASNSNGIETMVEVGAIVLLTVGLAIYRRFVHDPDESFEKRI